MVTFDYDVYLYEDYSKYTWRQKLKLILNILKGNEVEYYQNMPIEYEPY